MKEKLQLYESIFNFYIGSHGLKRDGGFAPPALAVSATASSYEGAELAPEKAIDGDFESRWASEFTDAQWLQIDLGSVEEIVGLTLHWEAAYGKAYDILLSKGGGEWSKVFTQADGDAKTDIIRVGCKN